MHSDSRLGTQIDSIQSALHNVLNTAAAIPVIGNDLGNNTAIKNIVGQFDDLAAQFQKVESQVNQATNPSTSTIVGFVQQQISSLLGSTLGDTNGDGQVDGNDVVVTPNIDPDGSWEFKFLLQQQQTTTLRSISAWAVFCRSVRDRQCELAG